MVYEMFIAEEAREQRRSLPEEIRQSIGYRLHLLQQDLSGDIKKREGTRSLFSMPASRIDVYALKQRKDAYG